MPAQQFAELGRRHGQGVRAKARDAGLLAAPNLGSADLSALRVCPAGAPSKSASRRCAPSYARRFAAYELSYCEGREREAYERLHQLYAAGERERLPTLIKRLKFLEEKLNIPVDQRIPDSSG